MLVSFSYFFVFDEAVNSHFDDFVLTLHFLESDLLLLLGQLDENLVGYKGEGNSFIAVSACSAYSVDVGSWTEFLHFLGLVVVNYQRDCAYVYTATDSFSSEEYLYFLVSEFGDSSGFGGGAIFRVDVEGALSAKISAVSVYVVNLEVYLACFRSLGIVDDEAIPLLAEERVELPQLWDGVEEDDDLRFDLYFGNFFQDAEDEFVLVGLLWVEVGDSE